MNRTTIFLILMLLVSTAVYADQGVEAVKVRVTGYNAATREYNFSCTIPQGTDPLRYWTIRPDTTGLETSFFTNSPNTTYTLTKDVLYHIGCQIYDGSQYVRGDFHIDRRLAPNPLTKTNIVALSTDGLQATLKCEYNDTDPTWKRYDIEWRQVNATADIGLPALHNQPIITANVTTPGLWDYACTYKLKSSVNYTEKYPQWGFPIEFFPTGPAYLPSQTGCLPGDPCPWENQTISNTTNVTQSISFVSTTTPGNHTANTSEVEIFSFILSNPSNLSTAASWFVNDSNQTSYFNSTSFSFGPVAIGAYAVRVQVDSSQNSISQAWTVNILEIATNQSNATNTTTNSTNGTNATNVTNSTNGSGNATNGTNSSSNATNATNATVTACYSSVQSIPANCTGGTFTQDTFSGCRTLICTSGADSLKILACDKTGFFEMYKQTQVGNAVSKICIGTTCITNNGYAKSANYPICMNITTNVTNGTGNTSNSTNTTNATIATTQNISFASVNPASNVTINATTSQLFNFTLSNPSNLSTAASWLVNGTNQTASFNASSFTMNNVIAGSYNITLQVGSSQNSLSAFWMLTALAPVNMTNATNTTNSTNATNTTTNGTNSTGNATNSTNFSVSLGIAPWFPQGKSYVFKCNATGFAPTAYDFYFGDGNKQLGRTTNDVYYTYSSANSYDVSCTARNSSVSKNSTLAIIVS